jgi:hypothetical protein
MKSFESLPPEARTKFDQAMSRLSQIGLTPPGFPAQMPMQSAPQMAPSELAFTQSPSFVQSSTPAIKDDTSSRTGVIIIAVLAVLLLCALAAAGILLLNR